MQRDDPTSTLHRYRALLAARRRHLPATHVPVDWLESGSVLAYRRGDLLVAANCGDEPAVIRPPGRWATVFATAQQDLGAGAMPSSQGPITLELHPNQAVMLRRNQA